MLDFLFNIIVKPLQMLIELLFQNVYAYSGNICFSILSLSFIVFFLCLPLYLRADALQSEEQEIQKKLSKRVNSIKKNFKGDERHMLLQTYYRQNNYHPFMALRMSLSLLLQIPVFMAAYTFFSGLYILDGMHLGLIENLALPDKLLQIGSFNINVCPILMTIVNLWAGYIYTKDRSFAANKMLIAVSLVFLVLLYNSPSGLVIYWIFNNMFSLIKNICLRTMTQERFLKYSAAAACILYYLFTKNYGISHDLVLIVLLFIILSHTEKFKNIKLEFNSLSLYLISIFSCWILTGIYIPSKITASSPADFIYSDAAPADFAWNAAVITAGAFIFWGLWIYYFADKRVQKFLSIGAALLFIWFSLNFTLTRIPHITLTKTFMFETADMFFDSYAFGNGIIFVIISALVLCSAAMLIIKHREGIIIKIFTAAAISCILLSIGSIKTILKTSAHAARQYADRSEKLIHLSRTEKNVLIIFLDRAINSYLPVIFEEKPQIKEQFKGFTYYPNTLSYAGYTIIGYLPILGGYEYTPFRMDEREGLFETKLKQAVSMLPALFSLNNWKTLVLNPMNASWEFLGKEKVKLITEDEYYKKYDISAANIPQMKNSWTAVFEKTYKESAKRNLIYYSLLSVLPNSFKLDLYDKGSWHNIMINTKDGYSEEFIKSYNELFYLADNTDFSETKNTFTVFNNKFPHQPDLLKYPDYDPSGKNDNNYLPLFPYTDFHSLSHYHVNAASLMLIGKYLDFLRKNNVYDNTRIIIAADHGFGGGLKSPAADYLQEKYFIPYNPLLMAKDFNDNEPLKTSHALMTNADVPIIALKGLIKNPVNPYTNMPITEKDKENGVIIKNDTNWEPDNYTGKTKILSETDNFVFINADSKGGMNIIPDMGFKDAQYILKMH